MKTIFRIGLLILGVAFIAVYFISTQNGRYQYLTFGKYHVVSDTRTGVIHYYMGDPDGNIGHLDFINGTVKLNKLENKESGK